MGFTKWLVVQKVTLLRGYGWANIPMMGTVFVGAVKIIFPSWVDTTLKFLLWAVGSLVIMYVIGYADKKSRLFHKEQDYIVESTPHLMDVVNREKNGT